MNKVNPIKNKNIPTLISNLILKYPIKDIIVKTINNKSDLEIKKKFILLLIINFFNK